MINVGEDVEKEESLPTLGKSITGIATMGISVVVSHETQNITTI